MKFKEVTSAAISTNLVIEETGENKGPLGKAIPGMTRMRSWGCRYGGYSWIITYEPGMENWTDAERAEWKGYTASYKGHSGIVKIDGGPWDSFTKAEAACKRQWKKIA